MQLVQEHKGGSFGVFRSHRALMLCEFEALGKLNDSNYNLFWEVNMCRQSEQVWDGSSSVRVWGWA